MKGKKKFFYNEEELDRILINIINSDKSYIKKVKALEKYTKSAKENRYGKWELGGAEEMEHICEYFDSEYELIERGHQLEKESKKSADIDVTKLWVTKPDGTEYCLCDKLWERNLEF